MGAGLAEGGEGDYRLKNPYTIPTVRCAGPGCSHVRQQVNHWFVVGIGEFYFTCSPLNLDADLAHDARPVCGSACAQKLFEQFLTKPETEKGKGLNVWQAGKMNF